MGHSVQLIVGQGAAIASFLREWPVARVVELRGGWQAIPVDEALYAAIEARHPGATRPSGLDVSPLGLSEAIAASTVGDGEVVVHHADEHALVLLVEEDLARHGGLRALMASAGDPAISTRL